MNVEALRQLRRVVADNPDIDMNSWYDCALGKCAQDQWFMDKGLVLGSIRYVPVYDNQGMKAGMYEAGRELFEIDLETSHFLFRGNQTQGDVLRKVDELLRKAEVDKLMGDVLREAEVDKLMELGSLPCFTWEPKHDEERCPHCNALPLTPCPRLTTVPHDMA